MQRQETKINGEQKYQKFTTEITLKNEPSLIRITNDILMKKMEIENAFKLAHNQMEKSDLYNYEFGTRIHCDNSLKIFNQANSPNIYQNQKKDLIFKEQNSEMNEIVFNQSTLEEKKNSVLKELSSVFSPIYMPEVKNPYQK